EMHMLRVLVLHNRPVLPGDHPHAASEREVVDTAHAVRAVLEDADHDVDLLGVSHDPAELLAGLRHHRPDVVFNLFEGTGDASENEAYVAGLLEWLGIPFTGCPATALAVARDKCLTKRLFRGAGLPTPEFLLVERSPVAEWRGAWPVIVKPGREDASL